MMNAQSMRKQGEIESIKSDSSTKSEPIFRASSHDSAIGQPARESG